MKPLLVFGARPNFMKIAPLYRVMRDRPGFDPLLVHTGQHFDPSMSGEFIDVLELPEPDVHFDVAQGSQAVQLAEIVAKSERVMTEHRPDVTVVVGDVTSTLGAALASHTLGIPVAHVEAGLRSRDWTMPEERNRVLTDRLSEYLFTPSTDGDDNLRAEGIDDDKIHFVGNVMIDSLDWVLPRIDGAEVRTRMGVEGSKYGLVTLHRAGNVDDDTTLRGVLDALKKIAEDVPLLFPVHPRTQQRLATFGITAAGSGVRLLLPVSYTEFIALLQSAAIVLTDSGGIQEEAAVLGTPCLTLRDNTERPITLEYGDNQLVGTDPDVILAAADRSLNGAGNVTSRPPLWDGHAAERIIDILAR